MPNGENKSDLAEAFDFIQDARNIAYFHGYGFGEQPSLWPKAEQKWFAAWFVGGEDARIRRISAAVKEADKLSKMLAPYISGDDSNLDKDTFLRFLADRISADLDARKGD